MSANKKDDLSDVLDSVQHLRHPCTTKEFVLISDGAMPFVIRLTDKRAPVNPGDVVTVEEIDENGEETGQAATGRVGCVVNTKDLEYSDQEIATRGLSIIGMVNRDYGSLYSLYRSGYTMSVAIDRLDEDDMDFDSVEEKKNPWHVINGPHYTPVLACPDFIEAGALNGLKIENWPIGRYSITLLINIAYDPEKDDTHVTIADVIIMTLIDADESEDLEMPFEFMELDPSALLIGKALHLHTRDPLTPAHPEKIEEWGVVYRTNDSNQQGPDEVTLYTEEELLKMIEESGGSDDDMDSLKEVFSHVE